MLSKGSAPGNTVAISCYGGADGTAPIEYRMTIRSIAGPPDQFSTMVTCDHFDAQGHHQVMTVPSGVLQPVAG